MSAELIRYDAMCRAIAEAYRVDEVKDIRDKAAAIAHYARQANNHEAELQAIQIRVRAERRAGELLGEIPKIVGDIQSPRNAETETKRKVLAALGISTQQASEWERLAGVPQDYFEEAVTGDALPSVRGIVYDYARLHGGEPAVAERTLTADDFANALLEGAIKDIQWLENKYSSIAFIKDGLANVRREAASRLRPKPPEKGSGIRVVK